MKKLLFMSLILLHSSLFTDTPEKSKTVLLAILARNKAHVLPRFLKCIENQEYDKKLITLYINTNNNTDQTQEILASFAKEHEQEYANIIFENHDVDQLKDHKPHHWPAERFKVLGAIRNKSLQKALDHQCNYYFVVDCDNFIAPFTLPYLIDKDKPIIAPLLYSIPEKGDVYSNYFADIDENGYYKSHPDYYKILDRSMVGTFKVPVVHCTYLIKSEYIDKLNYLDQTNDYEFVIFSRTARDRNIDQHICNEKVFGTLIHFYNQVSLEEEAERMKNILLLP